MYRRFSVFFSLLLAACAPMQRSFSPAAGSHCNPSPQELTDWRQAQRDGGRAAYRHFIARYPRSCFVPMATIKMKKSVSATVPAVVRKMPNRPVGTKNTGGGNGSSGGRAY